MQFLNDTVFKDEVLGEFMQRATDMEIVAGPKLEKEKLKKQTAKELMLEKQKRNPHRFYTITPFNVFMGLSSKNKHRSPERKPKET